MSPADDRERILMERETIRKWYRSPGWADLNQMAGFWPALEFELRKVFPMPPRVVRVEGTPGNDKQLRVNPETGVIEYQWVGRSGEDRWQPRFEPAEEQAIRELIKCPQELENA